jgi:hypothetical protein
MPEKAKQEQQQLSKERRVCEKSRPPKSSANLPLIYDENFARRQDRLLPAPLLRQRQT